MNVYSRIMDLCKISGDTMYSLSKHSGVSESTLSRLKTNPQSRLSKKNLILLANYFCVNEDWLETGIGDRDAPGVVRDSTIHDSALHQRFVYIANNVYCPKSKVPEDDARVDVEMMSTYTNIPIDRLYAIIYDDRFPTYTEIQLLLKSEKNLDANWLLLGEGKMFKTAPLDANSDKIVKLVDTITTLQDTINAKSEQIALLSERIKQLEAQLNK